jgi:hypothetical protein
MMISRVPVNGSRLSSWFSLMTIWRRRADGLVVLDC